MLDRFAGTVTLAAIKGGVNRNTAYGWVRQEGLPGVEGPAGVATPLRARYDEMRASGTSQRDAARLIGIHHRTARTGTPASASSVVRSGGGHARRPRRALPRRGCVAATALAEHRPHRASQGHADGTLRPVRRRRVRAAGAHLPAGQPGDWSTSPATSSPPAAPPSTGRPDLTPAVPLDTVDIHLDTGHQHGPHRVSRRCVNHQRNGESADHHVQGHHGARTLRRSSCAGARPRLRRIRAEHRGRGDHTNAAQQERRWT